MRRLILGLLLAGAVALATGCGDDPPLGSGASSGSGGGGSGGSGANLWNQMSWSSGQWN